MPPVPPAQRALGLAVAQRRAELNLSQEAISLRSDLHQRWISNIETGKRNPSYTSLRRLAAGLELTTSELIGLAEEVEKLESPETTAPAPAD